MGTKNINARPRITTIAFDLGGVLFDFDYTKALERFMPHMGGNSAEVLSAIFTKEFCSPFERGQETPEDFFRKFSQLAQLSIPYADFVPAWNNIFSLNHGTLQLIRNLKKSYPVFLISNINILHYEFLTSCYPDVFHLFNAQILSYRHGTIKPESKIYHILLTEARVLPNQIVYIDDRGDLIDAARKLGISSIRFNDVHSCLTELRRLGVSVTKNRRFSVLVD